MVGRGYIIESSRPWYKELGFCSDCSGVLLLKDVKQENDIMCF